MKVLPASLFLFLLPLASQTPVHSTQSLLEILGEDLAALLSANEGDHPPPLPLSQILQGQHPLHDAPGPPAPSSGERAWIHFLKDFVSTQKKFRGRAKKMGQQGCFGIKLDRIGTLSGLGC
ncbi:C-type natriuretic peptide-like [Lacerta agilis]|uniref:C-type natriuretic peptide-like n=1 Tax=Lacerta agilis TaxID=80427 RepID=UPI001419249B|nr:C-type natriuretic peptide-like [Lacerta agilis]